VGFDLAGAPEATPSASGTRSRSACFGRVCPERVSVLLGHSSIKVTEKYYSPWVRSRQEQLEAVRS
jgi:integrase